VGGHQAESRIRRLKYHHAFNDHLGVMRHYFRRNGKRTPLRGPFGSADFWADYNACLKDVPATPAPRVTERKGSFAALSKLYFASRTFKGLAHSSRKNYRRVINHFLDDHGHRLVNQFKREHVEILIGDLAEKPGAGTVLLKRIRVLVRFALSLKWIDYDPTVGVKAFRSKEIHTWTDAELEQFERRWAPGTKQRLAYSLLLYTGQRGSDTYLMSHTDIDGDTIQVAQVKTKQAESDEKLVIPMHPRLQRELALHRKTDVVILATPWGKPYSLKGFGQFVSKAIQAAKLPARCKAHGLRKAAARRLAEAGCSYKRSPAIRHWLRWSAIPGRLIRFGWRERQ
jgi:enterobacteria phage integrase